MTTPTLPPELRGQEEACGGEEGGAREAAGRGEAARGQGAAADGQRRRGQAHGWCGADGRRQVSTLPGARGVLARAADPSIGFWDAPHSRDPPRRRPWSPASDREARAIAHGRVRHGVQPRRAVPARAGERARAPAALHLLRTARGARQGGPRGRRADRDRQALRALGRPGRGVRRLLPAGRVAAPPVARAPHDGLDLPRPGDRSQPAGVRPARHADLDDGLRPLDGLPRPRRLGQREHAADPG